MAFLLVDLIIQPIESLFGATFGRVLTDIGPTAAKLYLTGCLTYGVCNYVRTKDQQPGEGGGILFSALTMWMAPFYYFAFPWMSRGYFAVDALLARGQLPRGAPDKVKWVKQIESVRSN